MDNTKNLKNPTVTLWTVEEEHIIEHEAEYPLEIEGAVDGRNEGELKLDLCSSDWMINEPVHVHFTDGTFRCQLPLIIESHPEDDPSLFPCRAIRSISVKLFHKNTGRWRTLKPAELSVFYHLPETKREEMAKLYLDRHLKTIARIDEMKKAVAQKDKDAEMTKKLIKEHQLLLIKQQQEAKDIRKKIAREQMELELEYSHLIADSVSCETREKKQNKSRMSMSSASEVSTRSRC